VKNTKLYSVLYNKCPYCHEGDFFTNNNPYNLKNFDKQPEHCPVCHSSYMPENGFYYGAMYVSYGLDIALGVALFILSNIIFDWGTTAFLILFVVSILLLWTIIFRKARLIWINLFVKYDKTKATTKA
jgi:RNA polymerase subunit RPABC4/transcription elongation factor Spt4